MLFKKKIEAGRRGRVGIPRAVSYFCFGPRLWETFLLALGFEPVTSAATSARTVQRAGRLAETEHCLPVKLFHAHLLELQGTVDRIFVPRLLSTLDQHLSCPKLSALPDVAAIEFPMEVLSMDIDLRRRPLRRSLESFARSQGAGRSAARAAAAAALSGAVDEQDSGPAMNNPGDRILVLGHPYILNDDYISGTIFTTLRRLDTTPQPMIYGNEAVAESFVKWDTLNRMYHRLLMLEPGEFDGVILISAFNCGCDSMLVDMFRSAAVKKELPFMVLMFDEHTSRGGLDTRLEAFVDSIRWRRR